MASLFDDLPSSDSEDDPDFVPVEVNCEIESRSSHSSDDEIEIIRIKPKKPRNSKVSKIFRSIDPAEEAAKVKAAEVKAAEIKAAEVKAIDEKKRAEDIYKSFLAEVEAESKARLSEDDDLGMLSSPLKISVGTPKSSGYSASGISAATPSVSSEIAEKKVSSPSTPVKKVSSEMIDQNESPLSVPEKKRETYDFAGETVIVSKNGLITSSDATTEKPSLSSAESSISSGSPSAQPVIKRKGGLESVLGLISTKKTKLSTLEKSKLDWNTFKEQEGIGDELERFNKGKGGYLERKRFLERSDIRSYEVERDLRLSRKKK